MATRCRISGTCSARRFCTSCRSDVARGLAGGVSYPVNLVIGGWQVNVIGRMATGTPVDLSVSGNYDGDRPDLVSPLSYPKTLNCVVQHRVHLRRRQR